MNGNKTVMSRSLLADNDRRLGTRVAAVNELRLFH